MPIAEAFGLRWASLGRTRRDAKIYGCCDSDGHIRIRLRSRASGAPLRYSSLIATVCHELAHLRYMDHGRRFQALHRSILEWARQRGIYQPEPAVRRPFGQEGASSRSLAASGPRRRKKPVALAPRQLSLFPPLPR